MSPVITPSIRRCAFIESGYTLIEVVVTLVILGIVALYALPRIPSTESFTLRSQAEKFASDLRRAQILASAHGTPICVLLNADRKGYVVKEIEASGASCAVSTTQLKDPITSIPVGGELADGAVFSAASTAALSFSTLGKPLTEALYEISASDFVKRVNVDALTGRVSVN